MNIKCGKHYIKHITNFKQDKNGKVTKICKELKNLKSNLIIINLKTFNNKNLKT